MTSSISNNAEDAKADEEDDGKASKEKSNLHITEDNTENQHGID